ncbi:VOC family protein [Paludibacter sp. 221]|uniref:VOC family protein n=1 Tax=Paludibacter sp. 221 TaxID=2302939 RepID=UPI0013D239EC|nr:VOC family protein [Paludibacter sp. 221]NDV46339.1 VOC family protein [Paludibacter sp. 221]
MKKLISWVEIPAGNFERAVKFYSSLLNLDFEVFECETEKMACFPGGEGAISFTDGFKPSANGTLVHFDLGDKLDEAIESVEKLGGKIVFPKTKIEVEGRGYFALFIDSEGNKVGLYGDE